MSWNLWNILNRSIMSNEHVLDLSCPKIFLNEIFDEVLVDTDEFSSQDSSRVYISSKWLKTLVVTQYL